MVVEEGMGGLIFHTPPKFFCDPPRGGALTGGDRALHGEGHAGHGDWWVFFCVGVEDKRREGVEMCSGGVTTRVL